MMRAVEARIHCGCVGGCSWNTQRNTETTNCCTQWISVGLCLPVQVSVLSVTCWASHLVGVGAVDVLRARRKRKGGVLRQHEG